MRYYILIILVAICFQAKAAYLFTPSSKTLPPETESVLKGKKTVIKYQPIAFNYAAFKDSVVQVKCFDESVVQVFKRKIDTRGENNFSYFGKSLDNSTCVIISVMDGDIQGLIYSGFLAFKIETYKDQYVLTRIDQNKFSPEICPGEKSKGSIKKDPTEKPVPKSVLPDDPMPSNGKRASYPLQTPGSYECKLRILVLYTGAAAGKVGNIKNSTQLCIDELNTILYNSQVNYEVELAHVQGVGHTETNMDADILGFATPSDGKIDEVMDLREKHSADVCVLLFYNDGYCGTSMAIRACQADAFCMVGIDCIGNFTFAHEIGHILGCRHNLSADEDEVPYIYGHGYKYENFVNNEVSYRTVMSYNCELGCPRIPYFSNPNVYHNGYPAGSSLYARNYEVLNLNMPQYMTFRPTPATRLVESADIAEASDMVYSANRIETSGTVSISSAQYYYFVARTEIELSPGFEANEGNTFVAELQPTNCGTEFTDSCNFDGHNDSLGLDDEFIPKGKLSIFPNPANSQIILNVPYSLVNAEVQILNIVGATVKTRKYPNLNAATDYILNIQDLTNGVYFFLIKQNNANIFVSKVIKQ